MAGRNFRFCSSVPYVISVGPTVCSVTDGSGTSAHSLVDEDLLFDLTEAAAPELDRPADSEPAVLAHPADDLTVGGAVSFGEHDLGLGRRDQSGEVATQFCLQLALFGRQIDEHRAPTRSSRYDAPPTRRARSLAMEK